MDIEELIFFNSPSVENAPDEPVRERKVQFVEDFGISRVTECYLEDLHFMHMDLSLNKETRVSFDSHAPVLEQKQPVAEVADAVGYKHAHHFAAAFKKQFGVLPGKIKK